MIHDISLFWFRQDLRLHDNTALEQCLRESRQILPFFIFDTAILQLFGANSVAVGFLVECIIQLDEQLRAIGSYLLVVMGDSTQIVPELIQQYHSTGLYHNRSYGLGGMYRDTIISEYCKEHEIWLVVCDDFLLVEPNAIAPKKVFTPWYKWRQQVTKKPLGAGVPEHITSPSIQITPLKEIISQIPHISSALRPADGGRKRLERLDIDHYHLTRNTPSLDGTSQLSPYIRFGVLSIREVYYHAIGNTSNDQIPLLWEGAAAFVSELAWREFWQHVMHYRPDTRYLEFQEKRRGIWRKSDDTLLHAWQTGTTGYPIVDAGMRQLQQTGWLHGRVRMIVASFLTKDLHIDWRIGEQRFAQHLVDYDSNVNTGNRQWSASVGADPKPLRIFSPILQSQRFDPQAEYIMQRVPELRGKPLAAIHDPLTHILEYCPTIVDHRIRTKEARNMYRNTISLL